MLRVPIAGGNGFEPGAPELLLEATYLEGDAVLARWAALVSQNRRKCKRPAPR